MLAFFLVAVAVFYWHVQQSLLEKGKEDVEDTWREMERLSALKRSLIRRFGNTLEPAIRNPFKRVIAATDNETTTPECSRRGIVLLNRETFSAFNEFLTTLTLPHTVDQSQLVNQIKACEEEYEKLVDRYTAVTVAYNFRLSQFPSNFIGQFYNFKFAEPLEPPSDTPFPKLLPSGTK